MKNENPFKISDRYVPRKLDRLHRLDIDPIIYYPYRHCKIKVLVVTDQGGSYGNANFGLNTFLKAFDSPLNYTSFDITKAHRRISANSDHNNFKFHTHDLHQYDVIFLFGIERSGSNVLTNAELRAVSEYMDNGGGIFATGDHEDLGVDMCGQIPRIRSMRRWYTAGNPGPLGEPHAPSQSGGGNHDTIEDTNLGLPGIQGNQSDLTPQKIKPNYRYGFASSAFHHHHFYRYIKYPHPVLCSPDGEIKVLPDHMHEGLCEVPSNLTRSFTFSGYTTQEYPSVDGSRIKPKVIARADNNVTGNDFGVIATLDGHIHDDLGRVLVDATWHHFFNINIRQFQILKDNVDGGHTPNAAEIQALEDYNYIQHYYRNIAYWLARRDRQSCFKRRGWIWLLNHSDINMSILPSLKKVSKFEKFTYFHSLGVIARNALGDLQSNCQSSAMLSIVDHLLPIKKPDLMIRKESFSFLDPELFETVCLGCSLHNLNELVSGKKKKKITDKQIDDVVERSSFASADDLLDLVGSSVSTLRRRLRKAKRECGIK